MILLIIPFMLRYSSFPEKPLDSSCDCNDECTGSSVICNTESNTCVCEPGFIKTSTAPFVCAPGNKEVYK